MHLCDYGCGQEATHQFKNGKWCCSKMSQKCSFIINKNRKTQQGRKVSDETKKKISLSTTGCNNPMYGKSHSTKTKLLFSKINKGVNNPFYGKHHTDKVKKQLSEMKKGKNHHMYGKTFSVESKKKMSKSHKGITHSVESRKKISKSLKGKIFSTLHKDKISKSHKGKIISIETRKRLSLSLKISIFKIKEKYPIFAKIEEMRYNPDKPGEKEIQVHCKNHLCPNSKEQGGWFTPNNNGQLFSRIWAIEKNDGNGGIYLYCSDKCKQQCPLYNLRSDPNKIPKEDLYTSKEYQTYRQQVFEREDYKCEYCEEPANHVHHSRPQKLEPGFVLDPDFGVACCESCHYKYGHKDECSTGNLASTICKEG